MLRCALHLIALGVATAGSSFRLVLNNTRISDESLCLAVDPEAPDVVKTKLCLDGDPSFVWTNQKSGKFAWQFRHSSGKCLAVPDVCPDAICRAEVKACVECDPSSSCWKRQQWTFGCHGMTDDCPGSVHSIEYGDPGMGSVFVSTGEVDGCNVEIRRQKHQLFYREFLDGLDPTPTPDPAPDQGPTPAPLAGVHIQSNVSSLCVDLPGGDSSNGALLWTWDCYGGETQQWAFQDGQLVYLPDPSKCVDLLGGDSTNGNKLGIWDCYQGDSQLWGFDPEWGTIYLAGSTASDATKCVQIGGEHAGDPLVIWDCTIEPNQIWKVGALQPSLAVI